MIKLRHHLIIACALGLSVTGVFAAWTFGSFEPQETELEAGVSDVLPADRWNFDTVYVTFNAGLHGDFGLDSNGDEITTKNLSTFEGRQITYDTYKTLNLNVDDGYLFIGWAESDDNKPFEIDVIRSNENDSEEYIAQYIDLSTVDKSSVWSLYDYNDNILGTFIDNPHEDGTQQILYNVEFIVEDSKKAEQIYYVQNHSDTPVRHELKSKYNYLYNSVELYKANENNVKSGIYYVIFDPVNESNDYSWHAHGGHVYLHRLYQYSVVGDPSNTWDSSSDSLVTFGYVETREVNSERYKVYRADNVFFDGDMDFEFKLNEADSYPYFSDITHTYRETYINVTNDGNANYVLDKTVLGTHDYYMMTFYINVYEHESNTVGNIYNYPRYVYLSVEIKRYTIYFYENSTLETPTSTYECKYNDPFPSEQFEPTNKFYTEWTDIDTQEIIDTSLGVIKDLHIYPSAYKDAVNVKIYKDQTLYKTYKIEKGKSLTQAAVAEINGISSPNNKYPLVGWNTSNNAATSYPLVNFNTSMTFSSDVSYYAMFEAKNILHLKDTYTDKYIVGNTSGSTISWNYSYRSSSGITYTLGNYNYYHGFISIGKSGKFTSATYSYFTVTYNNAALSCTSGRCVYFKANGTNNWSQSGAWFFVHSWVDGGASSDIKMTKMADYDYYQCIIPNNHNKLIFVRKDPANTNINWDNVWNQTGDLTLQTNNDNSLFTPNGWGGCTGDWGKPAFINSETLVTPQ